jgi:hypothetical protein
MRDIIHIRQRRSNQSSFHADNSSKRRRKSPRGDTFFGIIPV